jgi:hypothetical protein
MGMSHLKVTVFHLVSHHYPECFTHTLMFLAFGTSSFEVPATQCFPDQHTQSPQSQPRSVSFINTRRAHTDGYTAFPLSTCVKLTLPATQWFFHQHMCGAYNNDYAMFLPAAKT